MKISLRHAVLTCKHNAPEHLKQMIIAALPEKISVASLRLRLALSSLVSMISLVGAFFTYQMVANAATESGIGAYLKLVFTDLDSIDLYWKDFTYAILESLPAIEIVAFTTVLFVLGLSLTLLVRYSHQFFSRNLFSKSF